MQLTRGSCLTTSLPLFLEFVSVLSKRAYMRVVARNALALLGPPTNQAGAQRADSRELVNIHYSW
jgi:hypothetical protein